MKGSSVRSMSEDSPLPSQMNVEDALKLFGVAETASFDEIIKVRRDLVTRFEGNMEKLAEVRREGRKNDFDDCLFASV